MMATSPVALRSPDTAQDTASPTTPTKERFRNTSSSRNRSLVGVVGDAVSWAVSGERKATGDVAIMAMNPFRGLRAVATDDASGTPTGECERCRQFRTPASRRL